jgi:hypothetical protein
MRDIETNYTKIEEDSEFILLSPEKDNISKDTLNFDGIERTYQFEEKSKLLSKGLLFKSKELEKNSYTTKFKSLQKWEGVVDEIFEDKIYVTLKDLTLGGEDSTELEFEDIDDDDKHLLVPGAIFYWSIGYETTPYRQRSKKSIIRFRRLPKITPQEFDLIYNNAKELEQADIWE